MLRQASNNLHISQHIPLSLEAFTKLISEKESESEGANGINKGRESERARER